MPYMRDDEYLLKEELCPSVSEECHQPDQPDQPILEGLSQGSVHEPCHLKLGGAVTVEGAGLATALLAEPGAAAWWPFCG